MWLAFVIVLGLNGSIDFYHSQVPFETEAACVENNKTVESKVFQVKDVEKEVVAYKFECVLVAPETFKKPGVPA